jgi:hypothetical protein
LTNECHIRDQFGGAFFLAGEVEFLLFGVIIFDASGRFEYLSLAETNDIMSEQVLRDTRCVRLIDASILPEFA